MPDEKDEGLGVQTDTKEALTAKIKSKEGKILTGGAYGLQVWMLINNVMCEAITSLLPLVQLVWVNLVWAAQLNPREKFFSSAGFTV